MSVSRLVEGVSVYPPQQPLPTVGAEARSGFILPSTLAAMGWERPGAGRGFQGSRKKGEMERPRAEPAPPGVRGLSQASWQELHFSPEAVV